MFRFERFDWFTQSRLSVHTPNDHIWTPHFPVKTKAEFTSFRTSHAAKHEIPRAFEP